MQNDNLLLQLNEVLEDVKIRIDNAVTSNTIRFKFKSSQLPDVNDYKTAIIHHDVVFKELFDMLNDKINHCLYWFSLETNDEAKDLINILNSNRDKLFQNIRIVPAKNNNENSNILYVGVRRGGKPKKKDSMSHIAGRMVHHLGYYPKTTQGLQLVHWAKEKDYKITLNIAEFTDLPNEYLYIIEKIVAIKLKPLCGRH